MPMPGFSSTNAGAPPVFNPDPAGGQAGVGSTGYGSTVNRQRNGVINAGNMAGTDLSNAGQSRNKFMDMLNADPQKELSDYVAGAIPGWQKQIQQQKESSISRGIGTGDLGTAYEGSIDSAFQRNITQEAGNLLGKQMEGMGQLSGQDAQVNDAGQNRYLDALTGASDREQQQKNSHNSFLGGIIGTIGNIAGAGLAGGHI